VTRAFVGLGSNLGEPGRQLDEAVDRLDRLPGTEVAACSPRYWTAPVGETDQPRFLNAVVALETALDAHALLAAMLGIENGLGRERRAGRRWGPRTIDLDLLLFGRESMETPELTVPHPRMHERAFVLRPLADLAPDLIVPGHGRVSTLLAALGDDAVRPADEGSGR